MINILPISIVLKCNWLFDPYSDVSDISWLNLEKSHNLTSLSVLPLARVSPLGENDKEVIAP